MNKLVEVQGRLDLVNSKMAEIFAKGMDTLTENDVTQIQTYNKEATDLGVERDGLREIEDIKARNARYQQESKAPVNNLPAPQGQPKTPPAPELGKGFSDLVLESDGFKNRRGKFFESVLPDAELKTLLSTTAGWAPETTRTGRLVDYANRRAVIADLMPNTPTNQSAIKFMEETTFTNAAATVAEGGLKPESALAFTERSVPVEKIATWLPVTDEQLEDVEGMRSVLDNRLLFMLQLTEEVQLLTGDGTPPNLQGFLTKAGVQTQAKGADPTPDAVYKAMTKIRYTGFAEPSAAVFHPNDWQDVRLLRTTDGIYIWGSPADPGPERIWGLPIVVTTAETENTALVGDFRMFSEVRRKRGIVVEASNSHSDYFIYNKQAIRAEERLALVIYRAAAFCKVTGV